MPKITSYGLKYEIDNIGLNLKQVKNRDFQNDIYKIFNKYT